MASSKKILMLLENNPYPQDTRVRREAQALAEAGYQVTVIAPRGKDMPFAEMLNDVYVYRYPAPIDGSGALGYLVEYGYSLIAMYCLSIFVFFRRGFDVIHAHNPPDVLVFVAILYKLLGKKFVFDHHDLSPELYNAKCNGNGNKILIRLLEFFEKVTFRFVDHVIATNESYKAIAMKRGGIQENQITVVRNGPRLNKLKDIDPDPDVIAKAGIGIGYLGEMGDQDGLEYLIQAIYHIVHDYHRDDIYAILIGDGSAFPRLKALSNELQLEDYIHFTGYQPDDVWRPILAAIHIGAVPDPMNPFNNQSTMIKITDYMGLRKPVVSFDLRENRVTAGSAALYAKPNDVADYASLIIKLMDDPDLREEMGKAGYERIVSSLAWRYQAEQLLQAYNNLLK